MKVHNNILAKTYVILFSPLLCLRFFPHLFFYMTSKRRKQIYVDLCGETKSYGIRFFRLLWALKFDPYFVSLFYYRIGWTRAFICSLTKKDCSTLDVSCDTLGQVNMLHPFATILNAKSIGDNFTFRNNTTIGNIDDDNSKRPVIGKNVTLGANVTIFGDITIGDNVIVGAGTVINKDIPSNSVVVGNPFRIIKDLSKCER